MDTIYCYRQILEIEIALVRLLRSMLGIHGTSIVLLLWLRDEEADASLADRELSRSR
jgi:hypothetical protein